MWYVCCCCRKPLFYACMTCNGSNWYKHHHVQYIILAIFCHRRRSGRRQPSIEVNIIKSHTQQKVFFSFFYHQIFFTYKKSYKFELICPDSYVFWWNDWQQILVSTIFDQIYEDLDVLVVLVSSILRSDHIHVVFDDFFCE